MDFIANLIDGTIIVKGEKVTLSIDSAEPFSLNIPSDEIRGHLQLLPSIYDCIVYLQLHINLSSSVGLTLLDFKDDYEIIVSPSNFKKEFARLNWKEECDMFKTPALVPPYILIKSKEEHLDLDTALAGKFQEWADLMYPHPSNTAFSKFEDKLSSRTHAQMLNKANSFIRNTLFK